MQLIVGVGPRGPCTGSVFGKSFWKGPRVGVGPCGRPVVDSYLTSFRLCLCM